jgi:hypothetical protein
VVELQTGGLIGLAESALVCPATTVGRDDHDDHGRELGFDDDNERWWGLTELNHWDNTAGEAPPGWASADG